MITATETAKDNDDGGVQSFWYVGLIIFSMVAVALVVRLPTGLDLSDESYYATFIDDWLNGGIAASTFLTLHQTAALLIYPPAIFYVSLNGSADGLFLFLRLLFFSGALFSSLIFAFFLRKQHTAHLLAWLGGAIILAFIPFGLPAPSYNTLGLQWMTVGLAGYGCAFLASGRLRQAWYGASAVSWTIATVAYPPLVVALLCLCAISSWRSHYEERRFGLNNFCVLAAMSCALGWALVIYTLSLQRLVDSVKYLSQINDVGGISRKITFSISLLIANPRFGALCVAAILCGLLRTRLNQPIWAVLISSITLLTLFNAPTMYLTSHDILVVTALSGIGLLANLRRGAQQRDNIIALIYAISLLAGFITTLAATNAVYNTCVGILPAAALALVVSPKQSNNSTDMWQLLWKAIPPCCALVALLETSLFYYYGEFPGRSEPREIIRKGFFSGIRADPREVTLLDLLDRKLTPLLATEPTLAVFGFSGLALGRQALLKMPTTFPLAQDVSAKGLSASVHFYEQETNRPNVVVLYEGPYVTFANPMQEHFLTWYRLNSSNPTPLGQILIYTRK